MLSHGPLRMDCHFKVHYGLPGLSDFLYLRIQYASRPEEAQEVEKHLNTSWFQRKHYFGKMKGFLQNW